MAMVVQQQQQHQSSGSSGGRSPNGNTSNNGGSSQNQGDTTYTKIFVGGLAWETMKKHFEQYGDIQEAVVIMDKNTGRSKGYGFVTFKEAAAAKKACADPTPVIDGRRANCNLASLGAHRGSHPSLPPHSSGQSGHFQGASQGSGMPAYNGGLAYPPPGPYAYQPGNPYSPFAFPAYPPDFSVAQGYYNPYATPQFSQVYTGPMYPHAQGAAAAGYFSSSGPGYMQAPPIVQYSGPGLVASTPPSSQYAVASVTNYVQTSGRMIYGALAALLFSGYIIYDTDNLIKRYTIDDYFWAYVSLYLDIINLFLALLSLFGGTSRD